MEVINLTSLELGEAKFVDGLPVAWPLLRAGDNFLTLRGKPVNLRFSHDDLEQIVSYHNEKGAQIPLDCQHVVSNLAGKINIDESELLQKMPRYGGVAGFGRLELRGDQLYLSEAEYLPIGKEVMHAGQYRYFSPTLRGLDGKSPLRLTSVALTNEPCLQNPASLAASGDYDDDKDDELTPEAVLAAQEEIINHKEAAMPDKDPEKQETTSQEAVTAKEDAELLSIIKEILGEDVTPENLKATLAALKTQAETLPELKQKVDALELAEKSRKSSEEARALEAIRQRGLARGVLTRARLELPYVKNMNSVELSQYCESLDVGCAAPVGVLELGERTPATSRTAAKTQTYNSVAEAIDAATVTNLK